jgi:GT2 family glycosyltransferase
VLGVSIVVYRSPVADVVATCRALAAQSSMPALVTVHINQAADHALSAEIEHECTQVLGDIPLRLTTSMSNLGFCEAHNTAMRELFEAGCSAVLVLNPDLVLEGDAVAALEDAARDVAGAALLGPVLELAEPETFVGTGRIDTVGIRWTAGGRHLDDRQGEPLRDAPTALTRVAGISGACLYVPRLAFELIDRASGEFFDADFIAYREDAELAYRAGLLEVPSYVVPAARGRHVRRLRGTTRGQDPAVDALGVRNRFLIAFKYGARRPGRLPAALTRDAVVIAAVAVRERSSLAGLREAWRLRSRMRAKGRQVQRFAAGQQ